MTRGERIDKDVAVSTWEGDGDSTDVVLCANRETVTDIVNTDGSMDVVNGSTVEKDISQEGHIDTGEDNSLGQGGGTHPVLPERGYTQHEPENRNDHLGTARTTEDISIGDGGAEGGGMVSVDRLIERFEDIKAQDLKPGTIYNYVREIRKFAGHINLGRRSKRDLQKRGRKYILDYLRQKVPKKSRKKCITSLETLWEDVLEMDFPLRKSDIKKLRAKAGRGYTPSDAIVLEWADTIKHIKDAYKRSAIEFIFQGPRPSHIVIRWGHINRDKEKRPVSIVAYPKDGEFKTDQPVAMHIPPDLQQSLMEWEEEYTKLRGRTPGPDDFIWPWRSRSRSRTFQWDRPMATTQFWRVWEDLRSQDDLPKLTPRDVRHWVSTAVASIYGCTESVIRPAPLTTFVSWW